MEESTVSIITSLILLKLWYVAVQIREKNELKGLKDIISSIIKALIDDAEKIKQVEDVLYKADAQESNEEKLKELLQDTFSSRIKGILVDAEKEVRDLEDALYEADNLMDVVYNEAAKQVEAVVNSKQPVAQVVNSKQLVALGRAINKNIKQKLEAAAARDNDSRPINLVERPEKEFDPDSDLLLSDRWIFDLVKDIKPHLLNRNGEEHVPVLAIVGYGGLGKTTLAQRLFKDQDEVERHFELRIWVNAPCDFNMRSLVEGIILYTAKKDSERRRQVQIVINSLLEGIIVSTAKNSASQSQVRSARKRVIERLLHETDDDNIQRWSGFETEIMGAMEEHFHHLDEGQFCEEMSARQTVLHEEMSTTKEQLRHLDEGAIQIETDEGIFKSLVMGIIVSTAKNIASQSQVVSARQKVCSRLYPEPDLGLGLLVGFEIDDVQYNIQSWKGFETEIKTAIQTHFRNLDEGQFREEMSARQKEYLEQLNQTPEQLEHKKDDEGPNEFENEMSTVKDRLRCLDEGELHEELRTVIDGKRLLLVLDGVLHMDSEMWLEFKNLLSDVVGDGSRIIITTRSKLVGKITASTDKDVHMLHHQDERNSCELFQRYSAFTVGKPVNFEIVEIAVEIVKRCGGNPFALQTVGEKLKSINLETKDWSDFFNTEFQKVVNEEILPSFKLSYDVLPPHLKHCFAYCSTLPRDSEIDVKNLINLWMAQGLIYPLPGQRMEDVGYAYVKDLCQRYSLFEQVEVDHENGFITKCKMPKLMHDLAVLVAGTRLATLKEKDKRNIGTIDERTQHVSFHFHFDRSSKIPSLFQEKRPRIRTIILPSQLQEETHEERLSSSTYEKIISKCEKLRTLDLHSTGIKVVPESIGKLKFLRYLDLSHNKAIKSLPDSITKIPYLMTLKLSSCYGLKELPKDMKKLVHLKHLEIDWCYSLTRMPPGLGQLTQLETLSEFVLKRRIGEGKLAPTLPKCLYRKGIDLESLKELGKLNNLRGALKIKNLRNVDEKYSEVANLKGKEDLKSLTLSWDLDLDAADEAANGKAQHTLQGLEPNSKLKELALFGYSGDKLSDWLPSLTNLVKFSLQKCKCGTLQPLTQLTSLKVLILDNMPNLKYISNKSVGPNSESNPSSSTEFIKKLEELRLTDLPHLEGWWEEGDASLEFPRLSKLMIEDCPKLSSMPLYPNLKEWLVLKNTRSETLINTMKDESSSTPLSNLQSMYIIGNVDVKSTVDIRWESLKSLRFLRFDNLPNLNMLPTGLKHVTTLQELEICRCTMKQLRIAIQEFKQLKRLELSSCPILETLSEEFKKLLGLETLEIVDCPILLQKCQKETGADWKKIRHIENILLQHQPQDHIIKRRKDDALKTKRLYEYYWDPKHGKSTSIKRTVLN